MKKYTNKILVIAAIALLLLTSILLFVEWKNGTWERVNTTFYNNQGACSIQTVTVIVDEDGNAEVVEEGITE